jgi:hypothetical protein
LAERSPRPAAAPALRRDRMPGGSAFIPLSDMRPSRFGAGKAGRKKGREEHKSQRR